MNMKGAMGAGALLHELDFVVRCSLKRLAAV